jgi:hypothetical protein
MTLRSGVLEILQDDYVFFYCPGCQSRHLIKVKTHQNRRGWGFNGNHDKPTFTPSVLVTYDGPDAGQERDGDRAPPARCHSFVTDGKIQFLGDSTHALAGQTVALIATPLLT